MNINSTVSSTTINPYSSTQGSARPKPDDLANDIDGAPSSPAVSAPNHDPINPATEPGNQTEPKESQASSDKEKQNNETDPSQLTQEELQLVEQLKQTDSEVRKHEMAHVAAGGAYITSGATFSYKQGPDGNKYAVAGEVGIDTSTEPGDPQATLRKMRQVKAAALAPASPSSQDIKVASQATAKAAKALSDLTMLQAKQKEDQDKTKAFGNAQQASDAYTSFFYLSETGTSTFQIAV